MTTMTEQVRAQRVEQARRRIEEQDSACADQSKFYTQQERARKVDRARRAIEKPELAIVYLDESATRQGLYLPYLWAHDQITNAEAILRGDQDEPTDAKP